MKSNKTLKAAGIAFLVLFNYCVMVPELLSYGIWPVFGLGLCFAVAPVILAIDYWIDHYL